MEDEGKVFTTFDKAPEFFEILSVFLSLDLQCETTPSENQAEYLLLHKLIIILQEYQEEAYLLDPFLERIMTSVVDVFKAHVAGFVVAGPPGNRFPGSPSRLTRLASLIYNLIKTRGRKTIVNFFPHQVSDLSIVLDYLSVPESPACVPGHWQIRYILLLWLSVICMIPFDLAKFDDVVSTDDNHTSTAEKIQSLAIDYLARSGLECEGAAILLSKLYTRADTSSFLGNFIGHALASLNESPDCFKITGMLHVLCEIIKSGIIIQVQPHITGIRQILNSLESNTHLPSNVVVRRFRIKLEGRLAVGVLPARPIEIKRRARALQLDAMQESLTQNVNVNYDETEIPDDVEATISLLLEGLQDKDTKVRYSAAKHLSRVSARLPPPLTEQVLESVLQLFSIHASSSVAIEDIPAAAEATWHGACLACAEMARRGLIQNKDFPELLSWLKKALLFDIRKGAHSVGSSVRDAASYVLWALARSHDASGLKPHALSLAQRIVSVSLYDREVHIRRAASAAFQENVGRLSYFPDGIDIIRKADFFSVGVRKNAFLVAAVRVAEHEQYRLALVDHLITHTLVHWDPSMRLLGSQSLRAICELDLAALGPEVEERVVLLLESVDANDVHGGLLGLSELAAAYKVRNGLETEQLKIFGHLSKLRPTITQKLRNEQIHEAACLFLANTMSMPAIMQDQSPNSQWRIIIEGGLRHRNTNVQEAAATAMKTLSTLIDCSSDDFPSGSPALQQSLARAFGSLAYNKYDHAVRDALNCLLGGVKHGSPTFSTNVEARRNCYLAIPELLCTLQPKFLQMLNPTVMKQVFEVYIEGLDDYTTDERGDVGSWVRIASIRGICMTTLQLFDVAPSLESPDSLHDWLPHETLHEALGGILKQGVERLDNVRRQAGVYFMKLLRRGPPNIDRNERWNMHGYPLLKQLFLGDEEEVGWNDGQWLPPKAVRILEIKEYRRYVLHGLILSIGSKTDSTQRPVAVCLTNYISSLPLVANNPIALDLFTTTNEILDLARRNPTLNKVVIPVLQTLDLILDAGILGKLRDIEAGIKTLQEILDLSTRNVTRLKNVQRILASMKIVHGMLDIPCVSQKAASFLPRFLLHEFPKVRTETAEHLYLVMQAKDFGTETDEAENILLETDWTAPVRDLEPKVDNLLAVPPICLVNVG